MRGRQKPSPPNDSEVDTVMRCRQVIMQSVCVVLTMFAWIAAVPAPAAALTIGDKVSNHLMLGNKQIPLPAGEWVLAGLGTQPFTMPALGAFGTIQTAVLFLPRGDRIDAVLEVNTNTIPVNDG